MTRVYSSHSKENKQHGGILIFGGTGTCEVRISRFCGDLGDIREEKDELARIWRVRGREI